MYEKNRLDLNFQTLIKYIPSKLPITTLILNMSVWKLDNLETYNLFLLQRLDGETAVNVLKMKKQQKLHLKSCRNVFYTKKKGLNSHGCILTLSKAAKST